MSKFDRYTNFRGGMLSRVSGESQNTIDSWDLVIGDRKREGHPRYDAADAVAVVLMGELKDSAGIVGARAAAIVNRLRPLLPALVERILEENAARRKWKWIGGPYAVIAFRNRVPQTEIVEDRDLARTIRAAERGLLLVLPIRRQIGAVILQLDLIIAGEDPFAAAADVYPAEA